MPNEEQAKGYRVIRDLGFEQMDPKDPYQKVTIQHGGVVYETEANKIALFRALQRGHLVALSDEPNLLKNDAESKRRHQIALKASMTGRTEEGDQNA